jgi:hypothetical protein
LNGDVRGWRVALVADMLINPRGGNPPAILPLLEAVGYGLLQLPPDGEHGLLLAVIADQVAEYAHHGYAVVAIGVRGEPQDGLHWRSLVALLRHRKALPPPRHLFDPDLDGPAEAQRLTVFLRDYDLPAEQRQRWRG